MKGSVHVKVLPGFQGKHHKFFRKIFTFFASLHKEPGSLPRVAVHLLALYREQGSDLTELRLTWRGMENLI